MVALAITKDFSISPVAIASSCARLLGLNVSSVVTAAVVIEGVVGAVVIEGVVAAVVSPGVPLDTGEFFDVVGTVAVESKATGVVASGCASEFGIVVVADSLGDVVTIAFVVESAPLVSSPEVVSGDLPPHEIIKERSMATVIARNR